MILVLHLAVTVDVQINKLERLSKRLGSFAVVEATSVLIITHPFF